MKGTSFTRITANTLSSSTIRHEARRTFADTLSFVYVVAWQQTWENPKWTARPTFEVINLVNNGTITKDLEMLSRKRFVSVVTP